MDDTKRVKVRLRVIMRRPYFDVEGNFVNYIYNTQWTDIYIDDVKPLPEVIGGEWVYIVD